MPDIAIAPFQAAHVHESRSDHNSPVEMQPVEMQPEDTLLARARQLGALPRRVFIQPRDARPADSGYRGARAVRQPDAIEGRPHFLRVWHIFVVRGHAAASPRGDAVGCQCAAAWAG